MGIRDRLNMIFVETSRPVTGLTPPYVDIGYAHPIVATSMGRAYLAACDAQTRQSILNEVRLKTPADWARYRTSVDRSLGEYRRLGFCMSFDFFRPGIVGVGVALRRPIEGEIIVFNCALFAESFARKEIESRIGPRLVTLCRAVENSLPA
jgi:DNA-binding IclR family transcriptional regulator